MNAVILVGGFGTRLRPLTLSKPKPLVEFINKPIVSHQIDELVLVGVEQIIFAVSYLPDVLNDFLRQESERVGIKIIASLEDFPLDTAGPIGLVADKLKASAEDFFVFNCDIICSFPLREMYNFHKEKNAEATILVTKVNEPSRYGVVLFNQDTKQVSEFVEKPKSFINNRINAGIYLFKQSALSRFKPVRMSMEKVVFPAIAKDKTLFAFEINDGFWMDVGMPKDFIIGTNLYFKVNMQQQVAPDVNFEAILPLKLHRTSQIEDECKIGPNVVIGPGVKIGRGVRLRDCTILANSTIGDHSWILSSIVGWNCKIGKWVRIENYAVIGENVSIKDELYINGASILPHKSISESISEPAIIM
ncbi:hypothetical protein GJ496_011398 [Pomphorhynchus laevis]|nr:hypothetical protein GJ496_011398 [Pomphorhynchus laevis]